MKVQSGLCINPSNFPTPQVVTEAAAEKEGEEAMEVSFESFVKYGAVQQFYFSTFSSQNSQAILFTNKKLNLDRSRLKHVFLRSRQFAQFNFGYLLSRFGLVIFARIRRQTKAFFLQLWTYALSASKDCSAETTGCISFRFISFARLFSLLDAVNSFIPNIFT